jgi:hypothetical protein
VLTFLAFEIAGLTVFSRLRNSAIDFTHLLRSSTPIKQFSYLFIEPDPILPSLELSPDPATPLPPWSRRIALLISRRNGEAMNPRMHSQKNKILTVRKHMPG